MRGRAEKLAQDKRDGKIPAIEDWDDDEDDEAEEVEVDEFLASIPMEAL